MPWYEKLLKRSKKIRVKQSKNFISAADVRFFAELIKLCATERRSRQWHCETKDGLCGTMNSAEP
jgi:hypothetical protein